MSRIVLRPTFGKAVEVANLPVYAGSTTVTPTQSTQTLNTGNKLVASNITVEPMPAGSAATPTSSITPTVTMSVDNDGKVTATVSGSREITPSVSAGYVTSGTPGTVSVSGAGELQLPKMTSDNMTASGNTVTAPAGFYPSAASRSVISGSATTPATEITPSISISLDSSNGQISAAVSGSKSVTPTVSEGYVTEGIAGTVTVAGTSSTSIPIKTAETFHPSTSDQTISSGKLLTGDQTIKGVTVTNLTAGNIKDGVTVEIGDSTDSDCVTSVTGTYEGDSPNLQAKTNIDPTTSSQTITYDSGYDGLSSVQINAMPSGTAGTPTATKGTVSNHSVSVTPSVTNTTGYINGGTKTGTAVTVSASELVSGTKSISANGTGIDVTNYATVDVSVSGGDSVFVITLTYNSQSDMWEPDCTYSEAYAAYQGGKTIVAEPDDGYSMASITYEEGEDGFYYAVTSGFEDYSPEYHWGYNNYGYIWTSEGIELDDDQIYYSTYGANAAPSDVASGKKFYNSAGLQVGTAVPSGQPNLQTKSVTYTPSTSQQTDSITADSGYDGLDEVDITVNAMPSGTEGTPTATKGTVSNHSISVTPSVTNSAGYISGGTHSGTAVSVSASELVSGTYTVSSSGTANVTNYASISVASGSATPASSISGTSATVSTGTNTLTLSKTVSNTPQVSAGYVSSGTAGNSSVSLTANVTTKATATIYPSASDQTISSSTYLTGTQTIKGVTYSNLTADNIKNGVTVTIGDSADADRILSVTGTYSGGGGSSDVVTGTLTVASNVNTSTNTKITDTTAIGFTPKKFLFYRSDRSATSNHVNQASFVTLGSSYYVRTMTRYSSNALSTSGNANNWTTQTAGYLYFNSNTVYFRSSSSYILPAGTWNWVAIK